MQEKIKNFLENNGYKIAFLIVSLIIACFVFYYFTIYPRQQQAQINNIDLQTKCAIQTKKIFNDIQVMTNAINYTYKNHYSSSLNRCYILIHGIGVGGIGTSDKLIDVFENKDVADCETYSTAPELNSCIYNGLSLKYNIDQFNDFIKPYMETK